MMKFEVHVFRVLEGPAPWRWYARSRPVMMGRPIRVESFTEDEDGEMPRHETEEAAEAEARGTIQVLGHEVASVKNLSAVV